MTRGDEPITVTPQVAREVMKELRRNAPERWRLMPIGGTLMGLRGLGDANTTKDVDVVLVALQGRDLIVPTYEEVRSFAEGITTNVEGRKDQTAVVVVLSTDHGRVRVEFIRGRSPGKGGYFVSRSVLEEAASELAREQDGYLELPVEALAFLKAWAAHDKQKLVDAGKDGSGYHASRREAFVDDVRRLLDDVLDNSIEPNTERSIRCSARPVGTAKLR